MSTRARRWIFGAVVAAHLTVLYWPKGVSNPDDLPIDKVVHAGIFGMVLLAGVYAGLAAPPLIVLLCLHAGVSELVQHFLLPGRTGDPWDFVADVTGVVLVTAWLRTRRPPVSDPG